MDEPEVALLTKEVLIDKFNHAANYVIFAGMLLVSALIGVFFCIRNVICINFLQYVVCWYKTAVYCCQYFQPIL